MNYNVVMLCGKCKECWKKLLFLLLSHSVRNAATFVDYRYKYNVMDQTKLNVNKHAVEFVKRNVTRKVSNSNRTTGTKAEEPSSQRQSWKKVRGCDQHDLPDKAL